MDVPRAPRIAIPNLIYHVVNRGIQKGPLFHDDADRHEFIDWLQETRRHHPFDIHHYSLMTNHYHLLIQPLEASLSKIMQYFASRFAFFFNKKYRHTGHLFQARFHSLPVQVDRYYKVVCRYIALNAVRAGIVEKPEDYPWCNYGRLIEGVHDPLASGGMILDYFGSEPQIQRERYQRFVEEVINQHEPISYKTLLRMRSWGALPKALSPKVH
jgi:REP element-mobilizing transposase RayT